MFDASVANGGWHYKPDQGVFILNNEHQVCSD